MPLCVPQTCEPARCGSLNGYCRWGGAVVQPGLQRQAVQRSAGIKQRDRLQHQAAGDRVQEVLRHRRALLQPARWRARDHGLRVRSGVRVHQDAVVRLVRRDAQRRQRVRRCAQARRLGARWCGGARLRRGRCRGDARIARPALGTGSQACSLGSQVGLLADGGA